MRKRQLGLRHEAQEIGHRGAQANLHHPAGHRPDVADRSEVEGQRRPAQVAQHPAQAFAGPLSSEIGTVGPFPVTQAEDVAAPLVGDDPAVGERRDDFALRVERDETGGSGRADGLAAGREA